MKDFKPGQVLTSFEKIALNMLISTFSRPFYKEPGAESFKIELNDLKEYLIIETTKNGETETAKMTEETSDPEQFKQVKPVLKMFKGRHLVLTDRPGKRLAIDLISKKVEKIK